MRRWRSRIEVGRSCAAGPNATSGMGVSSRIIFQKAFDPSLAARLVQTLTSPIESCPAFSPSLASTQRCP